MLTHFIPFPRLVTERLQLRALVPTDAPEMFVYRSDPRMLEFLDLIPAETVEDAKAVLQRIENETTAGKTVFWGITLKNSPTLIGGICLWNLNPETAVAELGYMLHPDAWGQGYMHEALASVLTFGFEVMEAMVVEAYMQPGHLRSARLLERNGFVYSDIQDGYALYALHRKGYLPERG